MNFILEVGDDILFNKNPIVHRTIKTKAKTLNEELRDHYFCLGFYDDLEQVKATRQFNQLKGTEFDALLAYFESIFGLQKDSVLYGNWIEADMARTFLLPLRQDRLIAIAKEHLAVIFEHDTFTDDQCAMAALSWAFFSYFLAYKCTDEEMLIVNYHTAVSGLGYLLYQRKGPMFHFVNFTSRSFDANHCKFVYTLHYSCLGEEFNRDAELDVEETAKKLGLLKQLHIETVLANEANLFTAVSPQLCAEVKKLYNKSPDMIMYSGINSLDEKGEADDSYLNFTHKYTKQRIQYFLKHHFYGKLNMEKTMTSFTAGRDYYNDGFDLLLDSIAMLNKKMKDEKFRQQNPNLHKKNVVCFILHEAPHNGLNVNVLNKMALIYEAESKLHHMRVEIHQSLLRRIFSVQKQNFNEIYLRDLCTEKELLTIKNIQQQLAKLKDISPVCTHEVVDKEHPILKKLQACGIENADDDYCKVVWIPEKLNENGVIELNFREFVRGANLGIFPGLYKPFSFKAPECMCNGTACIVSSTHGFVPNNIRKDGQNYDHEQDFIDRQRSAIISSMSFSNLASLYKDLTPEIWQKLKSQNWQDCRYGIYTIDRNSKNYEEQVENLMELMKDFLRLSKYERLQLRNTMTRNCGDIDWKEMIAWHIKAYDYVVCK